MLHRGIFRRRTIDIGSRKFYKWYKKCCIAENFVNGVALSILHHGKFRLWHRGNNIVSRNFISGITNVASWKISSMTSQYQYGGIFRQWCRTTNVASWNISASHYQCYIAENFYALWHRVDNIVSRNILVLNEEYCIHDIAISIWRNIRQWRRTINVASWNILTLHYRY